ncbi:hypothetical protein KP509_38G067600 [Ceratopteris richardii]|uniref:F-box domain-containing protein n=1 Tax=Ceratopteris richardii TaxID=49495 RepID=A0A8T2Q4P8_CERRI|nr:hypothetical protein KP509_38G067600 [Ceratopteris richardii]
MVTAFWNCLSNLCSCCINLCSGCIVRRDGDLIPGLPEELVLRCIVPRLPWYTRPVCRSISKSWKIWIDSLQHRKGIELETRKCQLPLLRGMFLVCTLDMQLFITRDDLCEENLRPEYYPVQSRGHSYQMHRQWRKLPPLQGALPSRSNVSRIIASCGMVYVWFGTKSQDVAKIDLGCGDWTWKKLRVSHHFNDHCVDFDGKIYMPGFSVSETGRKEKRVVLAYDMISDQCDQVETWKHDDLRVVLWKTSQIGKHGHDKGLYALIEHQLDPDPRLELLVYDICSESWRIQEQMPLPEYEWSELKDVKLLSADCFEPPSLMDVNTTWVDYEEYKEYIRGSIYAVFREDRETVDEDESDVDEDDEGECLGAQKDPMLNKSTLMKARINLATRSVEWEIVNVIGCFEDARDSPIECFSVMG